MMNAAVMASPSRFERHPPDYSEPFAPVPSPQDTLHSAVLRSYWPNGAFDMWRLHRKELTERTGLTWRQLNMEPECSDPAMFDDLFPETIAKCKFLRILKSDSAKDSYVPMFADTARLFYKYRTPVRAIHMSEIGDFMFSKSKSPGCLFVRIDHLPSKQVLAHFSGLMFRYHEEGRKLVFVYDMKLATDPLGTAQYKGSRVVL